MKICVVTPYFQENIDWLLHAYVSVKSQTMEARHILVCDGGTPAQIPDFQGTHIVLQRHYQDHGNTARLIGCYNAMTQDADAIAFLDADHWYEPDHLRSLLSIAEPTQLDAVASARMLHRPDGTPLMKCPTVDGQSFVATSCMLVFRPAFRHLIAWVLQSQELAAETNQLLWKMLRDSGARMAFVDRPTVACRIQHQAMVAPARPTGDAMTFEPHQGVSPHDPARTTELSWVGTPSEPFAIQRPFQPSPARPLATDPAPRRGALPTAAAVAIRQAVAALGNNAADLHSALIEPLFNLPARLPNSAWTGHIPFLFALFRVLRPEMFVELGVHTGASLIAAASAAATYQLPTQLVGIDTFLGDEHTGQYDGDALYNDLRGYFARTFPAVRLERHYFADVLPRVAPGSIDILHIDGLHTYEAVRNDFSTWFDRVSPTGVILLHDISVRERGFGVHLLWEELKTRMLTLEFPHSHGLGVVLMAPDHERVRPLAALARDERAMSAYRDVVVEAARVLPERMTGPT